MNSFSEEVGLFFLVGEWTLMSILTLVKIFAFWLIVSCVFPSSYRYPGIQDWWLHEAEVFKRRLVLSFSSFLSGDRQDADWWDSTKLGELVGKLRSQDSGLFHWLLRLRAVCRLDRAVCTVVSRSAFAHGWPDVCLENWVPERICF